MTDRSASLADGAVRRLAFFVGVLGVLVVGFTLGARAMRLDLLSLGAVYMFTPLVAAVLTCYRHGISLRQVGLRLGSARWIAVSALWWPPVVLVIAGLSIVVPGVQFDPSLITAETGVPGDPRWLLVGLIGLVAMMVLIGVTVNAFFAFGEEFGWRGYLLWELAPLGFWEASVLIGVLWGVWHAPLVVAGLNYPSFPLLGIALFVLVCVLMSPIYTYLVVRGGSVLAATFFHGVFNATGLVVLAGTDDAVLRELVASQGGVVGIAVMMVILLLIWRTGTPDVERPFAPDTAIEPAGREPERPGAVGD